MNAAISLGFYYHYKHREADPIGHHAYEVTGLSFHTEDGGLLVLYRPLYETDYLWPADCFARPLPMFLWSIEKNGSSIPRFTRIEDTSIIAALTAIRDRMYPS